MYQHASFPIGIYDSGLGGLSVVKQVLQQLPQESVVYVADSARVPYGPRSPEEILRYNQETADFLMEKGIKILICACNTSTAVALSYLRDSLPIPVLGLIQAGANLPEPPKRVAVLATEATIRSKSYRRLLQLRYPLAQILEWPCPEFVPMIEAGEWDEVSTYDTVYRCLLALIERQPDQVILGCSHYPYLRKVIAHILGPDVLLVDPAERLVQDVKKLLQTYQLLNSQPKPFHSFYTTGQPEQFQVLAERYLEQSIKKVEKAHLEIRSEVAFPSERKLLSSRA